MDQESFCRHHFGQHRLGGLSADGEAGVAIGLVVVGA